MEFAKNVLISVTRFWAHGCVQVLRSCGPTCFAITRESTSATSWTSRRSMLSS